MEAIVARREGVEDVTAFPPGTKDSDWWRASVGELDVYMSFKALQSALGPPDMADFLAADASRR